MIISPDRLRVKIEGSHVLTPERLCYDLIRATNTCLLATEISNYQKHLEY